MPFVAFDRERGERINILHYLRPKEELAGRTLVCPLCKGEMIIRHGTRVIRHFAHRTLCPYAGWTAPETPEHLAAKETLYAWLRQDPFWGAGEVELEVPIPEIRRVADILVTLPDRSRVVHECQTSRITPEDFRRRSSAYLGMGIAVFWWFKRSYLWMSRNIELLRGIEAVQGVKLAVSLRRSRKHDGESHLYHVWPERVTLLVLGCGKDVCYLNWGNPVPEVLQREIWRPALWASVYPVLKELDELPDLEAICAQSPHKLRKLLASAWLNSEEIYKRLHPFWKGIFTLEDLKAVLHRMWELGYVVAGPDDRWRLPYHPDFKREQWETWSLMKGSGPLDRAELSRIYHQSLWERRLKGAASLEKLREIGKEIAVREYNLSVRRGLRDIYRERLKILKSSAGK